MCLIVSTRFTAINLVALTLTLVVPELTPDQGSAHPFIVMHPLTSVKVHFYTFVYI
jgi:hypothetical protein